MSHDAPGPRPRQVTISGWLIAVTSAVLVVSVFDTMAQLHSLDTRDRLTKALTGWPTDLGITFGDALSLVRGALFVTAVAAVVTGILGIFVLQRHATARIVLTVAAVPLVLTAPVAGGVLGLLIGGGTVMLWTPEARDWFAGRAPSRPVREQVVPRSSVPAAPPTPVGIAPRVDRTGWTPPAYPVPVRAGIATVPREVRFACVLTWVFSALTGALYAGVVVAVGVARDDIVDRIDQNSAVRNAGLSEPQLVGALVAVSAVVVAWCIVAALLAALTWRRQPIGRVLLLVSSAGSLLLSLLVLPFSLVNVAACAATFLLLLTPAARAWVQQPQTYVLPPLPHEWPPPHQRPEEAPRPPSDKPPVW